MYNYFPISLISTLTLSTVIKCHSGFCNWGPDGTAESSTCEGGAQGGNWCNENGQQCESCGGRWCSSETIMQDEGFCNWGIDGTSASSTCQGGAQGGDWCNTSPNQCEICGGRWCINTVSLESTVFCNWGIDGTAYSSMCEGGAQGGDWCNANQHNCENGCGGHWCTMQPTKRGFCNWGTDGTAYTSKCQGGAQGGEWCNANQHQCEICGGRWCMPNAQLTTVKTQSYGTEPNYGIASTSRFWDCDGGSCGCAFLPAGDKSKSAFCHSNALFHAPKNNPYGAKFYGSASVSQALGGDNWLAEACGTCWKVTGTSNIPGYEVTTSLVLKGTAFCPPVNPACNGNAHFSIAAPGFDKTLGTSNACSDREPNDIEGFQSCHYWMLNKNPYENCDCNLFIDNILRDGCKNFLSLYWNNPDVEYERVECPRELQLAPPCWKDNGKKFPDVVPDYCASPYGETISSVKPSYLAKTKNNWKWALFFIGSIMTLIYLMLMKNDLEYVAEGVSLVNILR